MRFFFVFLLLLMTLPGSVRADSDSQKDAQVIANLLKYIHGVPASDIGVVYDPSVAGSQRQADYLVQSLSGKDEHKFVPVSIDALQQNASVKFVIVTKGLTQHFGHIASQAHNQRIFTLSLDTQCTQQNSCVLSIDTSSGVEIFLNETLLRELGFDVDAALRFMVKRV